MKLKYIHAVLQMYILPTTVCSSFNSHSDQIEKELTFYDPKMELQRGRTSGEEKFINEDEDTSSDMDDKLSNKNNSVSIDFTRKKKDKSDDNLAKIHSTEPNSNEAYLDNLNQHTILELEFYPLSNHYGINSTTRLDQATFARIKNSAVGNYNNPNLTPTAADKISLSSCHFLGIIYFYGLVPSTGNEMMSNYNEAIEWFIVASNAGHSDAQCALGLFYYRGCDANRCKIIKDIDKAIYWFSKAVELKNAYAHWLLGRALLYEKYWHGRNEEKQGIEAPPLDGTLLIEIIHLFQVAVKDNIPEAMHHLALLYEYDFIEIMKNESSSFNPIKKAVALYRKALHLNYHESAYNLALIFTYGRDHYVEQDLIFAMDLFRYAATQHNHVSSMRYLGIFAMNNGLFHSSEQPNHRLALYWFRKCLSTPGNINNEAEKYAKDLCRMELKELLDATNLIADKNEKVLEELIQHDNYK